MDLVMLDLDQTLISSEILDKSCADEGDKMYIIEDNQEKSKLFRYQNMEGLYVIFERPYLQEFLTFLFANFRVGVWTAASQDYANFIVKNIVIGDYVDRKLEFFLCSYHGKKSSTMYRGSKDLDMLIELYQLPECSKNSLVIVDDYDEVHKIQTQNCIIAKEFCYFNIGSDKDTFLKDLEQKLLDYLSKRVSSDGNTTITLSSVVNGINNRN